MNDQLNIAATLRELLHLIREVRADRHVSQAAMAGQMRISQNAYSKLESGKTRLNLAHLLLICELLRASPQELLKRSLVYCSSK